MYWDEWMDKLREYDERTFADYIDGGYDLNVTEEEDGWDDA